MRSLDLSSAVLEIKQTVDHHKARHRPSPFFLMVGAGISHPSVPLAQEIQRQCEEKARKDGKQLSKLDSPLDAYSHSFEQAFPDREGRKDFLRELMGNAIISRANFRLAHLLLNKSVTNLVLTPNFDDLLSRALVLFGARPVTCDHPLTLERIDPNTDDLQIVHIHGTFWFYDCCNLNEEISARATEAPTPFAMKSFLNTVLSARSPLVVGYSGWEGDVFMRALKERLSVRLRTNLYWFCYSHQAARDLPEWVRENPDVRIVTPGPEPPRKSGTGASVEDARREPSLTASAVFEEMRRAFNLPPLPLTEDPISFFADHLETSLFGKGPEEPGDDVYFLRDVIDKLKKFSEQEMLATPPSPNEQLLELFRNAVRQANHAEAIRLAGQLSLPELTRAQRRELSESVLNEALALNDNSETELAGYELVLVAGDLLGPNGVDPETIAQALLFKGLTLGMLNRSDDEIAAYDDLLLRFSDSSLFALQDMVAKALLNKGVTLGTLNRSDDEIATYDDLLRRFSDSSLFALQDMVAKALYNKGVALSTLNRSEDAIAAYDELLLRFSDSSLPALQEQVAKALLNKGVALAAMKRNDDAIAIYDDLLRRFADASEPALQEQVAKALLNKGVRLGTLNRSHDEIATYDDLLRRFADASKPAFRELVAKALFNKGVTLGTLNNNDDAIAAYDDLLRRFADASEPALQTWVKKARTARNKLRPPQP